MLSTVSICCLNCDNVVYGHIGDRYLVCKCGAKINNNYETDIIPFNGMGLKSDTNLNQTLKR